MPEEQRYSPFVWVTWITGLLAGDRQCRYAAWYKAHFRYEKVEGSGNLDKWKGEHAELVQQRSDHLRRQGWEVRVESQNKFMIRGRTATLSGCPDIVAFKDPAGSAGERRAVNLTGSILSAGDALVDDCKTGKRRTSDWWQVATYLCFLPDADARCRQRTLTGTVVYKDGTLAVPAADDTVRRTVAAQVRAAGDEAQPPATPNELECSMCDIAACPFRAAMPAVLEGETGAF
jgi:hypothetical protein